MRDPNDAPLQPTVLVVDDSRDAADALVALLQALGAHARAAYGGAEALAMLQGWRPGAVITDLTMPDIDGHELARRIRAQPALDEVLLVSVSGWTSDSAPLQPGFDAQLGKPIQLELLQALLARVAH